LDLFLIIGAGLLIPENKGTAVCRRRGAGSLGRAWIDSATDWFVARAYYEGRPSELYIAF
jgi:hypothetical protein